MNKNKNTSTQSNLRSVKNTSSSSDMKDGVQVEQNQQKKPAKGIYILPNLFTTAGLFAGFYAITQARLGIFDIACVAIYVAMVMDSLDGRLARLTNTMSDFGTEFDSLADMVSFGVAPAFIVYEFALSQFGKIGGLVAFVYIACVAIRLARFNVSSSSEKRYFTGLPSPAAAAMVVSLIWVMAEKNITVDNYLIAITLLVTVISLTMVSNVKYRSFKDFDFKDKMPFVGLIIIVLVFAVISVNPPVAFLMIGITYLLSGYIGLGFKRISNFKK